jgi:triosephosphate isomerase
MNKIYIYGNWKMNHGISNTRQFFNDLNRSLQENSSITDLINDDRLDIAFFPPFTSLAEAVSTVKSLNQKYISIGAQNIHHEDHGAFTGEVSIPMIKEAGCTHCLIGHSERRHIFGESNAFISKKLKKCTEENIIPVLCFGETLEEREKGETLDVIEKQLVTALNEIDSGVIAGKKVLFAYEPVWAIGTGKSAKPEDAQKVCKWTRNMIKDIKKIDPENIVVLYGGSVKKENAADLLNLEDVNGALVGGASLKVDTFLGIIRSWIIGKA